MNYTSTFGSDNELAKLRSENHALAEELAQCQADKEFVWSLWKRLQVANPDITQAIGMVIQREKEKTELKDRKVLEILQVKDDKIDELQRLLQAQTTDLRDIRTRKVEVEDQAHQLERENEDIKHQLQRANTRVEDLESRTCEQASRQAVRELDQENLELKQQAMKLEREVEDLTRDKDDLQSVRDSHKERMKTLEEDLKEMGLKYDNQVRETNDVKKQLRKCDPQVASLQREVEAKGRELEGLRGELGEAWEQHRQAQDHAGQQAALIRQLQALQHDTQQMLQNQEEAFGIEAQSMQNDCQVLKTSEQHLRVQLTEAKQELDAKEDLIRDMQDQLNIALGATGSRGTQSTFAATDRASDHEVEMATRLGELQSEVRRLKSSLTDQRPSTRDRSVSPLYSAQQSKASSRSRSFSKRQKSESRPRSRSLSQSHHSRPEGMRSREASPAPVEDGKVLVRRLETAQRKLGDVQMSLHMKTKELDELRIAHKRRLERLKSLQANYRLIKEQYKILEEEAYGPKKKKVPTATLR